MCPEMAPVNVVGALHYLSRLYSAILHSESLAPLQQCSVCPNQHNGGKES
jgi:hypothetical protein